MTRGSGGDDAVRRRPRFFPSDQDPSRRRVYAAATAFFLVVFLAVTWPVYARFAGIEPRVLGLPLSLAWVVGWVLASFLALLALYLWEERTGAGGDEDARGRDG